MDEDKCKKKGYEYEYIKETGGGYTLQEIQTGRHVLADRTIYPYINMSILGPCETIWLNYPSN